MVVGKNNGRVLCHEAIDEARPRSVSICVAGLVPPYAHMTPAT